MKRRTVKLSVQQRQELIEHRNHDPRPDVRERCAAVLKVADGRSPHAVALEGLLRPRDPDTVYGWLDDYEQEGIEGLLSGRQGGSRPRPFPRTRANLGTASARPWRGSATRVGGHGRRSALESVDVAKHPSQFQSG